jgi:hypothetical protein
VKVNWVVVTPSAVSDVGLAVSVEAALLGAPLVNVTAAVSFIEPTVAVTVFTSAVVDAKVVLYTPAGLVLPDALPKMLLEPVLLSVTLWFGTGLPSPSSTVMVSVVVFVSLAVTVVGLAVNVVVAEAGAPGTNVTLVVSTTVPMVAVIVLLSALVDARVAVKTPEALVEPEAGDKVLLEPVLPRETACPAMGLPFTSYTLTVNVLSLLPLAVTDVGLATNVVVLLLGAPAVNVTAAVAVAGPAVAVTVLTPAAVDAMVAVHTPDASVVPDPGVNVLLLPLEDSDTRWEPTGLP